MRHLSGDGCVHSAACSFRAPPAERRLWPDQNCACIAHSGELVLKEKICEPLREQPPLALLLQHCNIVIMRYGQLETSFITVGSWLRPFSMGNKNVLDWVVDTHTRSHWHAHVQCSRRSYLNRGENGSFGGSRGKESSLIFEVTFCTQVILIKHPRISNRSTLVSFMASSVPQADI